MGPQLLRSMCESHFRAMAMFLSIGSPSRRPPHPTTLVARCASQQGWLPMSESGQKRKCPGSRGTSVLPSGADIVSLPRHVRLVPMNEPASAGGAGDLAWHIVNQKAGRFEPAKFEDQYETALVDLINQKRAGKPIVAKERPRRERGGPDGRLAQKHRQRCAD
jgi:hypothetical protein